MKRDPLAWAALAAAIAVTASAEYALARACGFGPWVAGGVPAALDIYAVRALRARRDVLAVVVAMIAVNAASHLVTAGLLPVSVPLVVAVSAIAPLVLWRVHALGSTDAPDAAPDAPECTPLPAHPAPLYRAPEVDAPLYPGSGSVEGSGSGVQPELEPAPDQAETRNQPRSEHDPADTRGETGFGPDRNHAPPPKPAGAPRDAPDTQPHPDLVDDELLLRAIAVDQAARDTTGRGASQRRLQAELHIGQPRAQQLQRQMRARKWPREVLPVAPAVAAGSGSEVPCSG